MATISCLAQRCLRVQCLWTSVLSCELLELDSGQGKSVLLKFSLNHKIFEHKYLFKTAKCTYLFNYFAYSLLCYLFHAVLCKIGNFQVFGEGGVEESSRIPVKKLVVSALSKEVRLPDNEATLSAYTVPAEQPGKSFYFWSYGSACKYLCNSLTEKYVGLFFI